MPIKKFQPGERDIIKQTRTWLQTVVINNNFCPFARPALATGSIRFHVAAAMEFTNALAVLLDECKRLDVQCEIETTLVIYPYISQDFTDYLLLLELGEQLLIAQGYEGIYQLASFHPDYCFTDSAVDDPANYTNRSPFPMLHIIRESSIERALATFPRADSIPQRNIDLARRLGTAKMKALLKACQKADGKPNTPNHGKKT